MGKTIRRKNAKNEHGYYEWKDEVRQRHGAGDKYFHSDMPSRRGRWTHTFPVKDDTNMVRRAEGRELAKRALQIDDVEDLNTSGREQKHGYSDRWFFD